MSNEKMREEFEAWYSTRGKSTYYAKEISWRAWKASRSALCVELPGAWYQDHEGYILNREDDIKSSLDDAGVRYK